MMPILIFIFISISHHNNHITHQLLLLSEWVVLQRKGNPFQAEATPCMAKSTYGHQVTAKENTTNI
jgi:hypothetical protein